MCSITFKTRGLLECGASPMPPAEGEPWYVQVIQQDTLHERWTGARLVSESLSNIFLVFEDVVFHRHQIRPLISRQHRKRWRLQRIVKGLLRLESKQ
jgi:hypothetical protein